MIAPLREPETDVDANSRLLARARRAVASALLRDERDSTLQPQVIAWQAWLFCGWIVAMVGFSAGMLFGWWTLTAY